jgi:hypothetical protein
MKKLLLFVFVSACLVAPLPACQTPAVQNAEHTALTTAEACAKTDILSPLEGEGISLVEKVGAAILGGAGQTAIDQGVASAKADLKALPATVTPLAVNCAIKAAVAAYAPLASGHGFAGGDARLTAAVNIGEQLLAERGAQ